jgi:Leucine-rich repeat (LRR) protein
LDLTGLNELDQLYCEGNRLTSLDLSDLTNLGLLWCGGNQLTNLNVSMTNLWWLICGFNQLNYLDVSMLSDLWFFECSNNQLPFSSLATGLGAENFFYNPQNTLFEPETVVVNTIIDYSQEALIDNTPTQFVFFSNGEDLDTNTTGLFTTTIPGVYHCEMTNDLFPDLTLTTAPITVVEAFGIEPETNAELLVYPNPVTDILYINPSQNGLISKIGIYTIEGKSLLFYENWTSPVEIDLRNFKPGIYIVKVITLESSYELKIVKQ